LESERAKEGSNGEERKTIAEETERERERRRRRIVYYIVLECSLVGERKR